MNDKTLHFLAGLIIALLFGWLCYPLFGFIMAFFIGGLKEMLWDLMLDKGTPDMKDLWATALGGLVGCGILMVVE